MDSVEVKLERAEHDSTSDNIPTFLSKSFEILENSAYQDIISWTKNGEGFVVKKVKEFSERILPLHFRHNNYSSFVRQVQTNIMQLNMYDFHKMRQDNQQNAFKNSLFKRGCRHLLKQIQRKDYKKNKEMRVQISNGQQSNPTRTAGGYSELSSLNKEIEVELELSRMFYSRSSQSCLSAVSYLQKQTDQLNRLVELVEEPNNQSRLFSIIDSVLRLRRQNSLTTTHLDCFYDDWTNFLAKKNIKWNSLMPEERQPQQKAVEVKAMNFPTWATSQGSFGSSVLSNHRLPE